MKSNFTVHRTPVLLQTRCIREIQNRITRLWLWKYDCAEMSFNLLAVYKCVNMCRLVPTSSHWFLAREVRGLNTMGPRNGLCSFSDWTQFKHNGLPVEDKNQHHRSRATPPPSSCPSPQSLTCTDSAGGASTRTHTHTVNRDRGSIYI